ncbi:MAG: ribonuclease III [Planctomycetes bacterium]|nr:ribonuclease III [Planctomycetota bacterium]
MIHKNGSGDVNDELLGCQEAIGYLFRRTGLLRKALTHSSVKDEKNPSNERLEFLGDAILGMVVSEYLFSMLPGDDEGDLTRVKSIVVSGESLARLGLEIGVDKYLLINKGLRKKDEIPRSLIANAVEALIAAVYLDRGMEAARHFVLDLLHHYIDAVLKGSHEEQNHKSLLQQQAQRELGATPLYKVLAEKGPEHSKLFRVAAVIGGREYPAGRGANKKDAEQDAARIALEALAAKKRTPDRPRQAAPKPNGGGAAPARRRHRRRRTGADAANGL